MWLCVALCDEVEEVEEEQGVPGEQAGAHGGVARGDTHMSFIPTRD